MRNQKEFFTSKDLVELGIFQSDDSAYSARRKGIGPSFFRLGKKILYTRLSIQTFIKENTVRPEPKKESPPESTSKKHSIFPLGRYADSPSARPFNLIPPEPIEGSL